MSRSAKEVYFISSQLEKLHNLLSSAPEKRQDFIMSSMSSSELDRLSMHVYVINEFIRLKFPPVSFLGFMSPGSNAKNKLRENIMAHVSGIVDLMLDVESTDRKINSINVLLVGTDFKEELVDYCKCMNLLKTGCFTVNYQDYYKIRDLALKNKELKDIHATQLNKTINSLTDISPIPQYIFDSLNFHKHVILVYLEKQLSDQHDVSSRLKHEINLMFPPKKSFRADICQEKFRQFLNNDDYVRKSVDCLRALPGYLNILSRCGVFPFLREGELFIDEVHLKLQEYFKSLPAGDPMRAIYEARCGKSLSVIEDENEELKQAADISQAQAVEARVLLDTLVTLSKMLVDEIHVDGIKHIIESLLKCCGSIKGGKLLELYAAEILTVCNLLKPPKAIRSRTMTMGRNANGLMPVQKEQHKLGSGASSTKGVDHRGRMLSAPALG